MDPIPVPSKIDFSNVSKDRSRLIIEPLYPGYGTTVGNALRRILLSSLPGAAVTAVKIEGVDHEFSTIPNVKEDVVMIILNLKLLRFTMHESEPVTLSLSVSGEKQVTGADFKGSSSIEVINQKHHLATITDKAGSLRMEIIVGRGRGYVPVENREKEKLDVGWIAVDAIYTPVKTVNFTIDHVRVGQITNYDRLTLDVETDGTIKPIEAIKESAKILVDHFLPLSIGDNSPAESEPPKKKRGRAKKAEPAIAATEEPAVEKKISEVPDASS